ncbi:MAG TPA: hypothetical protein VI520_05555 [Anaerolineales bacterium]|nr:hypothetical protein [Anaerolineales bacterium]
MNLHSARPALGFLVLIALTACDLSSGLNRDLDATTPSSTVPALLVTTPVPVATISPEPASSTPEPVSPTPRKPSPTPRPAAIDLSSFSDVRRMGRLSLTQGWVLTDSFNGECGADPSCRARLMLTEGLIPMERLLWTEDAGASWSDITPAGLSNCPPPDICTMVSPPVFLDSSRVRIAVLRGQELEPPTTLSFMYTENGGRTWGLWHIDELHYGRICPGEACISDADLEFSDPLNGWLAASAPLGMGTDTIYLYRTRDGGQSWTALVKVSVSDTGGPGFVPKPIVHHLTFIDASTGWEVGGWRFDTGQLLVTRNGGSSWQPVELLIPEAYVGMSRAYDAPVFFSHDSGVLPVRFYGREDGDQVLGFYITGNAGGTWLLTATLEDPELNTSSDVRGIAWSAIDEATWFVAVSETRQYLTRDRGLTWEVFAAEGLDGAALIDVQFVSEVEGWGLGRTDFDYVPRMFATHDGGRTWMPIAPSP